MRRRRGLLLGLGAAAAVLVAGRAVAGVWADWRWFEALGAGAAWQAAAREAAMMRGLAFLASAAFAAANLAGVRRSILQLVLPRRLGNLEIGEEVPSRAMNAAVAAVAGLAGILAAAFAPTGARAAAALAAARFGETDPFWQRDLGDFVTWLPFEAAWYEWAVLTAGAVGLLVMVAYAVTPAVRWREGRLHVSGWVRRHVTVLGAVALLLLAWGLRLDAYTRVIEGSGPDGLVTALDHRVLAPAALLLAVSALVAGMLVLRAGWTGQLRAAFAALSAVLVGMLLVRGILPLTGEALVAGDADEAAYAETRRAFTRRAYAVEAMRVGAPAATEALPVGTSEALGGIPAWDAAAIARLVERSRPGVRVVGDAGWWVDGAYGLVLAAAPAAADDEGPWTVVTADPRREADGSGLPVLSERAVAPVRVFAGAAGSRIVADPARRLAAPRFGGWWARLGHAWALQQPGLALAPVADAALLETRDVRARVARLVPGFAQGGSVVPIVAGDTLWWGLDLYAASAWFPVSRRLATRDGDVHYLRHAATALVNATTGLVRLAARDDADPPARAALARLAGLVVARDAAGPALADALPVPTDQARAQAWAFALAGTRDLAPTGGRRLPPSDGGDTLLSTHGPTLWRSVRGRPAWSIPVVSAGDTVTGVVVATGGALPATRWAPSATRPLWGESLERLVAGAAEPLEPPRVEGQVRVVPRADGGLVLVQPRYVWPVAAAPALAGVGAVLDGETRRGRTMAAIGAPSAAGQEPPVDADARARLGPLYDRLREALRRGDFPEFGRLLEAIGRLLGRVPEATHDR